MQSLLQNRIFLVSFSLLILLLLLFQNDSVALWDEDEAAYAAFGAEMLETGDWVNPAFTWSEIHRKTPFHFWSIAVSYSIFGVNTFALRLPTVLAILLTLLAIWRLGGPIFGEMESRLAALLLGCSLAVPTLAKIAFTDAWLVFFESLSLLLLFRFMQHPRWTWSLAFWISIGLGVLVKGPPILILSGGVWLYLAILHPERKRIWSTQPWLGLPLALLPFGLWVWASWARDDGQFLTFLYEWYVVARIDGNVLGQTGPPGYHLAVALIAFLPFLPFFPAALIDLAKKAWRRNAQASYLAAWLLFGWLFYEAMSSKLPSYALGAHPAFAFALAQCMLRWEKEGAYQGWVKGSTIGFMVLLLLTALGIMLKAPLAFGELADTAAGPLSGLSMLLWMGALVIGISIFVKKAEGVSLGSMLGMGLAIGFAVWGTLVPILENSPVKATPRVAEVAAKQASTETPVVLWGMDVKQTIPSLPFYLSRRFEQHQVLQQPSEAQVLLEKEGAVLWILGTEAKLQELKQNFKNARWDTVEKVDYWSTDDALGSHPYRVVRMRRGEG